MLRVDVTEDDRTVRTSVPESTAAGAAIRTDVHVHAMADFEKGRRQQQQRGRGRGQSGAEVPLPAATTSAEVRSALVGTRPRGSAGLTMVRVVHLNRGL